MLQIFAHSQSLNLAIHGEMSNTTTTHHLQQFFFPFLAFNCECARSSVVVDVSTMLNDIILDTVILEMCCSGNPQSISNVEVGEKIFGDALMVVVCKRNNGVPS